MRFGNVVDGMMAVCALAAVVFLGASYLHPRAAATETASGAQAQIQAVRALESTRLGPLKILTSAGGVDTLNLRDGKTKLITVFRSTCTYCEMEASTWAELASAYPAVEVMAVNMEGIATAQSWLGRQHIRAARVIVPADIGDFVTTWRTSSVPVTLVVDPWGTVEFARLGLLGGPDLDALRQVLASSGSKSRANISPITRR
jgi:thiol-disulfide isomerase/thioredoxin